MVITGYIIQSQDGRYLDKDLHWVPHSRPAKGYVFTAEQLAMWGGPKASWPKEARTVFEATLDTQGGGYARLDGSTMPFSDFLAKTVVRLNQEKIATAINQLDEHCRKLHEQALGQGFKDEICPETRCSIVLLAHQHLVRCDPTSCPMISRQNLNPDGQPKSLLDTLAEGVI